MQYFLFNDCRCISMGHCAHSEPTDTPGSELFRSAMILNNIIDPLQRKIPTLAHVQTTTPKDTYCIIVSSPKSSFPPRFCAARSSRALVV